MWVELCLINYTMCRLSVCKSERNGQLDCQTLWRALSDQNSLQTEGCSSTKEKTRRYCLSRQVSSSLSAALLRSKVAFSVTMGRERAAESTLLETTRRILWRREKIMHFLEWRELEKEELYFAVSKAFPNNNSRLASNAAPRRQLSFSYLHSRRTQRGATSRTANLLKNNFSRLICTHTKLHCVAERCAEKWETHMCTYNFRSLSGRLRCWCPICVCVCVHYDELLCLCSQTC